MASILQLVVSAIVGVLGIIIFGNFFAAVNTEPLSAGAVSILNVFDLILVGGLAVGLLLAAFQFGRQ